MGAISGVLQSANAAFSVNNIARATGISRGTVRVYVLRMLAACTVDQPVRGYFRWKD